MAAVASVSDLRRKAEYLLRTEGGERAIAAHRALLAIAPALVDAWFNLGWLHRRVGDWEAAIAAYDRAIALGGKGSEEALLNKAVILSEHLSDPDAARTALEAALRIDGRFVAALLNLAGLDEDLGRREAARAGYERALSVAPDGARALARLAELADDRAGRETMLARIEAALVRVRHADDRAELQFARSRLLDQLGRYDAAMAAVTEANALARSLAAQAGWRYNRAEREALVDAIIAAPIPDPAAPGPAAAPLFLCGMFRSGTTLLEQMIASHPALRAGGEIDVLPRLAMEMPAFPDVVAGLDGQMLAAARSRYAAETRQPDGDGRMTIDKRPDNFLYLGLAKRLFPSARILVTRRDPRDVILSNFFLRFDDSVAYSTALDDAAHWLVQERRLAAHWRAAFPDDIFDVDYDRLVVDPERELRDVFAFLGLPWDAGCLRHHERRTTIRTPSGWAARAPLHRRSSGRWRHYATAIEGPTRRFRDAGLLDGEA